MDCPLCGLSVLIVDGKISQHLRPQDLRVCNGEPSHADHAHEPERKTPAAHKAPAKKAAPSTKHG